MQPTSVNYLFSGYRYISTLYHSKLYTVYRAFDEKASTPVILKVLTSEQPRIVDIERLKREFFLLKEFANPFVVKAIDIFNEGHRWILKLEDINGVPLSEIIKENILSIDKFFHIAANLCMGLDAIHKKGLLHKDIKPANILITPDDDVRLIDFSIAQAFSSLEKIERTDLEGTLEYISPEQTGRFNRVPRTPSDLYSLGVTFYEMLSGSLPFSSENILDLLYGHLSKAPPPLVPKIAQTPAILLKVVMKLLEKEPEKRYQTALGLKKDLDYIRSEKNAAKLDSYSLGTYDTPPHLSFPTELYGRDKQLEEFKEKIITRSSEFLIEGYSGIGKSSLVEKAIASLDVPVVFIEGKLEQFQDKTPLIPLVKGLRSFFGRELYFESLEVLSPRREFWKGILKENGALLMDYIPEIKCIKEAFSPLNPHLSVREKKELLFETFFKVFQEIENSSKALTILFFDDLQWVDLATLEWLKIFLPQQRNFVWIGAFRSNEVGQDHPLKNTITDLRKAGVILTDMPLPPLEREDIEDFLKDTLGGPPEEEVTKWVQLKSGGNPFFIRQLLEYLQNRLCITYSLEKRCWILDKKKILSTEEMKDFSVADLMAKTFYFLPEKTRFVLSIASLYGISGPLELLKNSLNMEAEELHTLLQPAISLGLCDYFLKQGEEKNEELYYLFLHDQVQQAAYQELSLKEKQEWHKKIIESTLSMSPQEIAFHLNACRIEDLSKGEIERGIEANCEAAFLAESSSGTSIAVEYLAKAETLAGCIWSWEKNFDKMFFLYKHLASAYLKNLDSQKSEETFDFLLEKCESDVILQMKVHTLKIELYTYQDRFPECMEELKKALKRTNVPFTAEANDFTLLLKILKIRFKLLFNDLYKLPPLTDPWAIALIDLFSSSFTALLQINQKMGMLVSIACIEIMFKYGYPDQLLGIFFGNLLFFPLKDFKAAKQLYDYVFFLHKEKDVGSDWEKVLMYAAFIDHWFYPIEVSLEHYKEAYNLSYAKGNYYYKNTAEFLSIAPYFRIGTPLIPFDEFIEKMYPSLFKEKHWAFVYCAEFLIEIHRFLRGDAEANQEKVMEAIHKSESLNSTLTLQVIYSTACFFYYVLEKWDLAYEFALKSFSIREIYICQVNADTDDFFLFLTFRKSGGHEKEKKILRKTVHMWYKQSPQNSAGTYHLMEAVIALDENKRYPCFEHFQKAIEFFEKRNWWFYSAVAKELFAEACQKWSFSSMANKILQESYYEYGLWDGRGKQKLLQERIFLEKETEKTTSYSLSTSQHSKHSNHTASTTNTSQIDLMSIIEASQAISEEIKLENLVKKITQILLKNSGAQRVIVFRKFASSYYVESEGFLENNREISVKFYSKEEEYKPHFPQKISDWMKNSEELLIINKNDEIYLKDAYFEKEGVKSAALIPIIHQRRMVGYVYLENFKVHYAFDESTISTLQLMVHQAAISLENASLYQTYKRFVPYEFLENLDRHNLSEVYLGDKIRKNLTILFMDIRNFTSMAENADPEVVFGIIHDFLQTTSPIIRNYGGFVDKFIGDAIMGIFPHDPDDALKAGLTIIETLKEFNDKRRAENLPQIDVGIGINTGEVILGVIGESERLETSVFGDSVNIASRIEALNRLYDTTILITSATKEALKDPQAFSLHFLTKAKVKGRKEEVGIWEVCLCTLP